MIGFGLAAAVRAWVPTLLFQVAAHGRPWSRKPDYEQITMEATHRLLGHTAWLVLVVAASAAWPRSSRPAAGGTVAAQGRAVLAVGVIAVGTVLLGLDVLAVLARVGDALSGDRLLLVAAGLTNARGIGILGLMIVVFLWGYDVWPTTESNVRPVAHAIRPSLSPGDVVVSTQPEQVPVLHHYLPAGKREHADRLREGRRRDRLARRRPSPLTSCTVSWWLSVAIAAR